MSDDLSPQQPESLGAGHRRAKAAKAPKEKAPASKKVKTPGTGKSKPRALTAPPARIAAAVLAFLKGLPGAISRLVDRFYEAVVADPWRSTKVLAAVVVGVALLGGVFWYTTDRYDRTYEARAEAIQAGQSAVISLLSYNFRSIDRQAEKTADLVTGKFKDEYAQFLQSKVAPNAKNKQIGVQTAVDEVGVVDSSPSEVELLMYIEQQSESGLTSDGLSVSPALRVTLEKEDGKWKVSELTPV